MQHPTIRDIAKKMNLSVPTVSKALNGSGNLSDATRARVRAVADEMGYVPNFMAAQIRRTQSRMIGIVVSDLSQPFFSQVLQACEVSLTKQGYQTLFFNSFEDPRKEMDAVRQLVSLNAAGCVLDIAQNSTQSIPLLRQRKMPFVLFGRRFDEDEDYYVVPDNRDVGFEATQYLISKMPDRPILCINGPSGISPTTERYDGYLKAITEAGRTITREHVLDNCFGMEDGYYAGLEAARRFEPPFGVFCSTDRIAAGFIRGLHERGLRIPEDVAVAGVDDIAEARYMIPSLTTVAIPKKQMAETGIQMLMDLIAGRTPKTPRILLSGKLIVRESA